MKIGIVGLGLIGGSLAKAIVNNTNHVVSGFDRNEDVVKKALSEGVIKTSLGKENISDMDFLIVCLYPDATVKYIRDNAHLIKKGGVVMDTCGVKTKVCDALFPVAKQYGFVFMGTHPMAGIEFSGYDHSKGELFRNASIILVPENNDNTDEGTSKKTMEDIKKFYRSIGFKNTVVSTSEEHDRIISYTSQLAHVVSSAYVKSPTASRYMGFSAGSFQDMTRVAKLNEDMWTELFMENQDYLTEEIDRLISDLVKYKEAIKDGEEETLKNLLKDGRIIRERLNNEKK